MKIYLKLTLYHELAIVEISFTQKAETEAQSTKFKVTPDTMVMHAYVYCKHCIELSIVFAVKFII